MADESDLQIFDPKRDNKAINAAMDALQRNGRHATACTYHPKGGGSQKMVVSANRTAAEVHAMEAGGNPIPSTHRCNTFDPY